MRFDWKWKLSDLNIDKPVTVLSTFSCGGGSTMGYKRAGFQVIGNVELDPNMNDLYVRNHHPKYNFLMDLRGFNKRDDLPEELFNLDILDGSPPCSTFSMAGQREDSWQVKKKFREGQKKQVLDDLFFVFLDTVKKLRPKIVVAENVTGLLQGNARGYVNEIIKGFHSIGYEVQIFKLNAALMDVPQTRERVFFIAKNQNYPKLQLSFNGRVIKFGEARAERGNAERSTEYGELVKNHFKHGDRNVKSINARLFSKNAGFMHPIVYDGNVCNTITANGQYFRAYDRLHFSDADFRNCSTFPQDYDFGSESVQYVCGMSVPPNMMAHIAAEIWEQWLKDGTK